MLSNDLDLRASDIQLLSDPDRIAGLFASLGYEVARLPQSLEALGIGNAALRTAVRSIERIASYVAELEIYCIELKSVTVANTQALARAFKDLSGDFLLVLTDDYDRLDFVLIERLRTETGRTGLAVRPRTLTVDRRNPSPQALRTLRRFTFTEPDALGQYEKLLSAYTVAEWSAVYYNNRALFSDYYLNERLRDSAEWKDAATHIPARYREAQSLMSGIRERLNGKGERAAFTQLYEPLLNLLGFRAEHAGTDSAAETADEQPINPDFRLYSRRGSADEGNALFALMLAYPWNRNLDMPDSVRDLEHPDEVPGTKVVALLERGEADWVIVTNGKLWRLYSAKTHSRATNYYEIDLEEALAGESALDGQERGVAFLYWWLLFNAEAFVRQAIIHEGKPQPMAFLERVLEGSDDYAKALGERLKSRVFEEIFPHFAEGFITALKASRSDPLSDDDLHLVFQATLTLLYRLMFLLYAEARDLLPIQEARGYYAISLKQLKEEIAEAAGAIGDLAPERLRKRYTRSSAELYERLQTLFGVIDRGEAAYNMPQYNGGLFITTEGEIAALPEGIEKQVAAFLTALPMPDQHLALGLDLLARDHDDKTKQLVFIDFKSLGVRQLGSIYEGLLEFKVAVAPEKMAVVVEDGVEKIMPYAEAKKRKDVRIKTTGRGKDAADQTMPAGTVYLINTKQERKATGSYYTPDYIVKYIVQHTVGPVLEEKFAALTPRLREAAKKYHDARKRAEGFQKSGMKGDDPEKVWNDTAMQALAHDLFDLKVLDPAMGSGHFLVEVVDYVTDRIIRYLQGFPHNPVAAALRETRVEILESLARQSVTIDPARLTDVALLKRQVLKRCAYGVDLNPMAVELAKVSLWLDAFTLGAPLSFLDHHLKCGNSLIGARLNEVYQGQLPLFAQRLVERIERVRKGMEAIGDLPDTTISQTQQSKNLYAEVYKEVDPLRLLLHVHTSRWFGNGSKVGKGKKATDYVTLFLHDDNVGPWLDNPDPENLPHDNLIPWATIAETAQRAAAQYRFFHWELEFPEVFFGKGAKDGGFDAVVGNPPYVNAMELNRILSEYDKAYWKVVFQSASGAYDLYILFIEQGTQLVPSNKRLGLITPNKFLSAPYAEQLRAFLYDYHTLISFYDWSHANPFDDPSVYPIISIIKAGKGDDDYRFRVLQARQNEQTLERLYRSESLSYLPEKLWGFLLSPGTEILAKIRAESDELELVSEVVASSTAAEADHYSRAIVDTLKPQQEGLPIVDSGTIDRYAATWGDVPEKTDYLVFDSEAVPQRRIEQYHSPKLIFSKLALRIEAMADTQGVFASRNTNFSMPSKYQLEYYASILNSSLLSWVYQQYFGALTMGGGYIQFQAPQLRLLPIRQINFTTPTERRAELAEKGRKLYARCLSEGHTCVLEFVEHHLALDETDVIHDLLAFLAEQMIDLHKRKQAEMKRFLGWFETTLRIRPTGEKSGWDAITGKTDILNYLGDYQKGEAEKTFHQILDRLIQNKSKIGADIFDPALNERFQTEYEKSLATLKPIKAQLATTDALIDQVVYRLYGLTEEEIGIVEGRT